MKRTPRRDVACLGFLTALALVAAPLGLPGAAAHEPDRVYLACPPPALLVVPGASPCIARAANGDTWSSSATARSRIDGSRDRGRPPRPAGAATGAATVHTWTATQLVGFVSYGTFDAPLQNGEGGLAVLRIRASGGLEATLEIHCLAGTPPPGEFEGIVLQVDGGPSHNEAVQGGTLFVKAG